MLRRNCLLCISLSSVIAPAHTACDALSGTCCRVCTVGKACGELMHRRQSQLLSTRRLRLKRMNAGWVSGQVYDSPRKGTPTLPVSCTSSSTRESRIVRATTPTTARGARP